MDLGRAVDTQRDALLRLLARLLLVVEVLSCGPFDGSVTRWVCRALSSVLDRAERAAGYLVIGSARVLVARGVAAPEGDWLATARAHGCQNAVTSPDDVVSGDSLRARMEALKALLEDLPRHALRLFRRKSAGRRSIHTERSIGLATGMAHGWIGGLLTGWCADSRIDRPPDKRFVPA